MKPIEPDRLAALLHKYTGTKSPHVLIVDDDSANRKHLVDLLQTTGISVVEATDSMAALECLSEQLPGAILLALTPYTNGLEFLDRLRCKPEWSSIPVVALATEQMSDDELKVLEGYTAKVVRRRAMNKDTLQATLLDFIRQHVIRFRDMREGKVD
jgi:CheY-like chemotaxis protein